MTLYVCGIGGKRYRWQGRTYHVRGADVLVPGDVVKQQYQTAVLTTAYTKPDPIDDRSQKGCHSEPLRVPIVPTAVP